MTFTQFLGYIGLVLIALLLAATMTGLVSWKP